MFTDGMSRLTVAVSVTVALSLAVFLTILVLLLADLFCARLRRNRLRAAASGSKKQLGMSSPTSMSPASVATTTTTTEAHELALAGTPPFYYAQGVMHAPNPKDLLLAIPKLESAVWKWSPARRSTPSRSPAATSSPSSATDASRFVYISNPVYELGGQSHQATAAAAAQFGITEEDDNDDEEVGGGSSPPLSAMRKLPSLGVVACPPAAAALGFAHGRPSSLMVTDTNRASSSNLITGGHFFSSWSSK